MRTCYRPLSAALAALAVATCDDPKPPTAPARLNVSAAPVGQLGSWSAPIPWPVVAAHVSVLPDTRVILWVSSDVPGDTERHRVHLWTPATGALAELTSHTHNVFCSAHSFLADGRLLVAGGHIADNKGLKATHLFNYQTSAWEPAPSMGAGRWYPTGAMLGTGELAVVAGSDENSSGNPFPEVYDPAKSSWRLLRGAPLDMPYYPWTYLAPDGRMFAAGPSRETRYLNPSAGGEWGPAITSNGPFREWGSSVTYAPGKVMIVGGGAEADLPTNTAEVIDLDAGDAAVWRPTGSMRHARKHLNTVVLPNGKVLAVGGTSGTGFNNENAAVLAAELWDPATGLWTELAGMTRKRQYHSTAVLLADGRVLSAGGGRCGGCAINNFDAEIFSPPYLFKADGTPAARPAITAAPAVVDYGQPFSVQMRDTAAVARVTLVRLPATTHSFNQNQWFGELTFTRTAGALSVTAPATARRAPPGHYLLFVLDAAGVPSEAKVVQLRGTAAAPPPPPPPAAPGALRATTPSNTQVRLLWDDHSTSETDFVVERCEGAGCSAFAEVGRTGANVAVYKDTARTGGATYTYRVRAQNEAGPSGHTPPVAVTMPTTPRLAPTPVINRAGGNCLEVSGNSQNPGAIVTLWECHGGANQQWTLPPAGTSNEMLAYGTICLDAFGGAGLDGDAVGTWTCHGGANQQWKYTPAGELVGSTGKCIGVVGGPAVNNAQLALGPCTGAPHQQWDLGTRSTDQPPAAQFTASCTARQCFYNSAASTDDRGIAARRWEYGDGSGADNLVEVFKTYPALPTDATYTVTLTVTDGAGQRNVATRAVTIPGQPPRTIALTATGSKLRQGFHQVVLRWSGATSARVIVRGRGTTLATFGELANVPGTAGAYTDDTGRKGGATYRYQVCETGIPNPVCSAEVTVVF